MAPRRSEKSSRSTSLSFLFLELTVADADAGVYVSAAAAVVEAGVGEANAVTPDRVTGAGDGTAGEGGAGACHGIGLNLGGWSSGCGLAAFSAANCAALRRANPPHGSKIPCCKIPAPAELELEPAASLAVAAICFATGDGRFRDGTTAGLIGDAALRHVPASNSCTARVTLEDGRGGTMPAGSRAGGGGGGGGGAPAMGLLGFFGQLMGRERGVWAVTVASERRESGVGGVLTRLPPFSTCAGGGQFACNLRSPEPGPMGTVDSTVPPRPGPEVL